jgi:hypothetical protein
MFFVSTLLLAIAFSSGATKNTEDTEESSRNLSFFVFFVNLRVLRVDAVDFFVDRYGAAGNA